MFSGRGGETSTRLNWLVETREQNGSTRPLSGNDTEKWMYEFFYANCVERRGVFRKGGTDPGRRNFKEPRKGRVRGADASPLPDR